MNTLDLVTAEDNRLDVNGEMVQYRPSWQNLIIVGRIATDDDLDDLQKVKGIAQVLTGHAFPPEKCLGIVNAYFDRYYEQNKQGHKVIDFEQDAERIYASFYQAYKIDLHICDMSAGEFLALLRNLPEDCSLSQVVQIRTMELPKDKEARVKIQRAKQQVSLNPENNGIDNFSKSFQNMAKQGKVKK